MMATPYFVKAQIAEEPSAAEAPKKDKPATEETEESKTAADPNESEAPKEGAKPTEEPQAADASKEDKPAADAESAKQLQPAVEGDQSEATKDKGKLAEEPQAAESPKEEVDVAEELRAADVSTEEKTAGEESTQDSKFAADPPSAETTTKEVKMSEEPTTAAEEARVAELRQAEEALKHDNPSANGESTEPLKPDADNNATRAPTGEPNLAEEQQAADASKGHEAAANTESTEDSKLAGEPQSAEASKEDLDSMPAIDSQVAEVPQDETKPAEETQAAEPTKEHASASPQSADAETREVASWESQQSWIIHTPMGEKCMLRARSIGGRRVRHAHYRAHTPSKMQQEAVPKPTCTDDARPVPRCRRFMQIFVKSITGKNITINVEPSDTILDVKKMLHDQLLIPTFHQRLSFCGRRLKDVYTVSHCGIRKHSTLHLLAQLRGGMQACGWLCGMSASASSADPHEEMVQADVIGVDPQLLSELQEMSLPDLKKKAHEMGCEAEVVDGVDASDDPRKAAIELVLAKKASANELVRVARTVMEECLQHEPVRGIPKYTEPESIWEILDRATQPVKLLRGTWITSYAETDGLQKGFPRRQDLEKTMAKEAFLPREEVECKKKIHGDGKCLNIVSISYCWRALEHPDQDGQQLRAVAKELKPLLEGRDFRQFFTDAGIFWDFCSLHQKERTPEEQKVFKEALPSIDIWYQHCLAMTYIVNASVPNEPHVNYESRGWTFFERSCAELLKPAFAGGGESLPMITEFQTSRRNFPLAPELFAEQMSHKRFTNRGDKELVVTVYTKSCMEALRGIQIMDFDGMKVQQHDGKRLASVFRHCCSLEKLVLIHMDIDDVEVQDIAGALPSMPSLQRLILEDNQIGDDGATAIADALPSMPSLQTLSLEANQIGDDGAKAIADALPSMPSLQTLTLHTNQIRDDGAKAIADALPRMQPREKTKIDFGMFNQIGEAAKTMLENAEKSCNGKVQIRV